MYLTKNQVYHARTKRIAIRFHKIKELLSAEEIYLMNVDTKENANEMLTKSITIEKFKQCLDLLCITMCYLLEVRV